jgi:orotidine-5'-phosphate decarboxylase
MSRFLVALDFPDAETAVRTARRLADLVAGFKVGLELLSGPGPGVVGILAEMGLPVFCDAKLHDIPNTVEAAARQLGRYGARWVSVHALGGVRMLEAAREGLEEGAAGRPAGVLAVTVLTSLEPSDLAAVGLGTSLGKQVGRLARLADRAGCEGVVCPVSELATVSQAAPRLIKVTPGIRPSGGSADDQRLVATPSEAVERGADLLVVGRPVTRAPDPRRALEELVESLVASGGSADPGEGQP